MNLFFQFLTAAVFIRALLSWFALSPSHPLIVILDQVTEPILAPLRRVVPTIGMMDITPLVALILLQVMNRIVVEVLISAL